MGTLTGMLRKPLMLFVVAATLLPATTSAADPRGASPADPNPLAGLTFYNDPESPSMQEWRHLERTGQNEKADLVWKIASQPKALWLGRFTRPNFGVKVRRLIDPAKARGEVPIFTVLRAQATACGPTYQGGGPAEDRATMAWYDDLARVIGDDRVVIAFEPDSLGTIDCLARSRQDDRLRVLGHGVDVLSKLPNVTVYIEAGASDWESAKRTAKQLRQVGIAKVRGFMLNVTHYDWTGANIQHGLEISRLTGGKHFIINTAENGRGPVHYRKWIDRSRHIWRRITVWCNPGLRGLGPAPTTQTARPDKVDAYLWINRPGYAQSCQHRPIAWYLPRALTLARNATAWEKAPSGTRYGHFKHYPLKAFNIP
ncbi:MAG: endoglucanase [Thermoleophilaceae bacterium]|nr:endoglucanase [Thermoleophilaceae bacterium]